MNFKLLVPVALSAPFSTYKISSSTKIVPILQALILKTFCSGIKCQVMRPMTMYAKAFVHSGATRIRTNHTAYNISDVGLSMETIRNAKAKVCHSPLMMMTIQYAFLVIMHWTRWAIVVTANSMQNSHAAPSLGHNDHCTFGLSRLTIEND